MNHYEPVEKLRLQLITVINIQLALLSEWLNDYLSGHTDYSISIIAVTQPRGRRREGAWSYCVEQSFEWVSVSSRVVVRVSCGIYEPLRMLTTEKKAFLLYRLFRRLLLDFFHSLFSCCCFCCLSLIWLCLSFSSSVIKKQITFLFMIFRLFRLWGFSFA